MRDLAGIARGLFQFGERHENLDARHWPGGYSFGNSVHHTSPSNRTHPGMGWEAKERPGRRAGGAGQPPQDWTAEAVSARRARCSRSDEHKSELQSLMRTTNDT